MNPSGMFRAFLSVVSVPLAAAVLLGATPALGAVTIDIPCAGAWNWNASTQTLSCSVTPPPVPGAPSCSLAANPTSLPAGGGSVTLTATCSNSPTGYQWSASGVTFSGGATTTVNANGASITANTTFTVTATNGTGSGQASRSVQVGAVAGGLSCPGFSKTLFVNWDWAGSMSTVDTYVTQNGLGTNGILVIPFVPTAPANNAVAQLSVTQFPGTHMFNSKRVVISTQPCDLNPAGAMMTAQGSTPKLFYVVGTATVSGLTGQPQAASLTPGVQYYINVAERNNITALNPSGFATCLPGVAGYPNCELRIQLQKPSGH